MADLFDAFDAAPAVPLGLSLTGSWSAGAAASALASASALPATKAVAGTKRPRPDDGAGARSGSATESSATAAATSEDNDAVAAPPAAKHRKTGAGPSGHHDVGDAIDEAGAMDLDPRRNERFVEEVAAAGPPSDDDSDSSDAGSEGEDAGASSSSARGGAAARKSKAKTAKTSSSSAAGGAAAAEAGASGHHLDTTNTGIGDALKHHHHHHHGAAAGGSSAASGGVAAGGSGAGDAAGAASAGGSGRLMRGEVDESKTTAPTEAEADAAAALREPAKRYPFTLDPFQKRSIECLERNESVLVSAHTSAGKTVVAEYAIAMALRDKQRVIYTSPIKALSNQKYRDLYEAFSDVGLMTGDVTINPNASCLVMTTEILRSMLYRGSEVMREVKWVIFDEIHYMRDKERGVVWEESIIMLPHKVRFVFLSATIPNSREFAEWVAKIHHQTCHVVYTDYRPTPLQHFIFPAGGEGVYLVVDEKSRFREDNFSKAMAALGSSALADAVDDVVSKGGGKRGNAKAMGKGKAGGPTDLFRIIKMVMERKYDPVIVFSFSKRECETYALQIAKLDLTSADEKALIEQVFRNAIDSLSDDDRKLPQIEAILPLLKRGIGIHHGGLLPLLKEVIEILFQESLLKILFATETFSMGINMPARTVVFTASRKFDGTDFRWISAGEYIQMSGRAGRRGLDDRGIVIQMVDEKMEPAAAKDILKGTADPLNSAFHLGYNMLLNLLRIEDADPEKMMALSFHQFQSERAAPAMEAELARIEADIEAHEVVDEAAVAEYHALVCAAEGIREQMQRTIAQPQYGGQFLQPGRLVKVAETSSSGSGTGTDWGWGVVVNSSHKPTAGGAMGADAGDDASGAAAAPRSVVVVDVLLLCAKEDEGAASSSSSSSSAAAAGGKGGAPAKPRPATAADAAAGRAELRVVPVLLPLLTAFSQVRLAFPKDLRPASARQEVWARLQEVHRRFATASGATAAATASSSSAGAAASAASAMTTTGTGNFPLLDPIEDMRIDTPAFRDLVSQTLALQTRIAASPVHTAADRDARFAGYKRKLSLQEQAAFLRERIKAATALVMRDTLKRMKRVLRRLGHVNAENVVQTKGRVACEINTADELLCTELIFTGAFNDLDAAQAAALLSCLVYTEKGAGDDDASGGGAGAGMREELAGPFRLLQDAARRVAQVSTDCKIEVDADEYAASFNPGMMELVYSWVNGAKFVDICSMTKEFEGTIIRVIRRLEELCRQLGDAAKAIGDEGLEKRFKEASAKMRRDIIFAASLYL